jgi:hypothetical protein
MVYKIEDSPPEKPIKKKWKPSLDGRWGISIAIGGHELFVGLNISKIDLSEFIVKRRISAPGKGRVFNL